MNEPDSWEERTILAALGELDRDQPFEGPRTVSSTWSRGGTGADDTGETDIAANEDPVAAETLRRLYTELLGLLPYELDPVEPRPETRRHLMAAIAARKLSPGSEPTANVVSFTDSLELAAQAAVSDPSDEMGGEVRGAELDPDAHDAAAHGSVGAGGTVPASHGVGGVGSWWRPFGAIAALFALLALGLAGWLFGQWQDSEQRLARLDDERLALMARLDEQQEIGIARASLESQLERMGDAMTLMTTRGVEVCPLRPTGEEPLQPEAFAVLFMAPDRTEWFLRASQLEEPDANHVYKVWLYTAEGAIDAGILDPRDSRELRIASERLDDSMMLSIAVTLEDRSDADAPTGPMVLYGADKMQVL